MREASTEVILGTGAATGERRQGTPWGAGHVLHFDVGDGYVGVQHVKFH